MSFEKYSIIIIIITIISMYAIFYALEYRTKEQREYIQNLEEKVNILTIEYENYVLEDSLAQ